MNEQVFLNTKYHLDRGQSLTTDNGESNFFLVNFSENKQVLISPVEAFIWLTLQRDPSVKNLLFTFFKVYKALDFDFISKVIQTWIDQGILETPTSVYVSKKRDKEPLGIKSLLKVVNLEIQSSIVARLVNTSAKLIPDVAFTWGFQILLIIPSAMLILWFLVSDHANIVATGENGFSTGFAIILLSLVSISLHELAHGHFMIHNGLKVKRSGFRLYFGVPVFFVDTSTSWMKNRSTRILISIIGPLTHLYLAALGVATLLFIDDPIVQTILSSFIIINTISFAINLMPFLEFDGYYILEDLLGKQNLKRDAFEALRGLFTSENSDHNWTLIIFAIVWSIFLTILLTLSTVSFLQIFT